MFAVTDTLYIRGSDVRVNCYRCKSRNFTDRGCHDPFDKAGTALIETCKVAMGSSRILVPANFCIKVVGTSGERATATTNMCAICRCIAR